MVFQQGGLGQHVGTMKVPDSSFQMPIGSEFLVYTLDSLFYDQGKKLGFAHLDLEGLELDVLKGGGEHNQNFKTALHNRGQSAQRSAVFH